MKRLLVLVIVVGLLVVAFKAWESPYFSLLQIHRGLEARDPVAVERYVDLEAMVVATASMAGTLARDAIGVQGDDVGSKVISALVGAAAKGVGEAVSVQGAMELRRAVREGRVARGVGSFVLKEGAWALGTMETLEEDVALVELHGTCGGRDASLAMRFSRKDGPVVGRPWRWVMSGVDEPSVSRLIARCR